MKSRKPLAVLCLLLLLASCGQEQADQSDSAIPRGSMDRLRLQVDGETLWFGPFVGYHLKPVDASDLSYLHFVCVNEGQFYTRDLPAGALLFTGEAVLVSLPDNGGSLPEGEGRIQPVFPQDIPAQWLATRPHPQESFRHFHSCYDRTGPVRYGYWLKHSAQAAFTYDMGGRVGQDSVLHHRVTPGEDLDFPLLVEFDAGPR